MIHEPSYPALTLKEDILPELGLSITKAADQLGIARNTLSRVLNGYTPISPVMALRIEKWLGVENAGSADLWLAEQAAYDLWQTRSKFKAIVKPAAILITKSC